MLAVANCFLAQIFCPCPSQHRQGGDDEKPVITPDQCRGAANADCHQQQRPNATCRSKDHCQNSRLVCLHGSTLEDRKSTRLNSSHSQISYAVFCLKKKKL